MANKNIKKLSEHVSDIDEYIVDIASKEGLSAGLQEIDGGVNHITAPKLLAAGADVLVAGSYVFGSVVIGLVALWIGFALVSSRS